MCRGRTADINSARRGWLRLEMNICCVRQKRATYFAAVAVVSTSIILIQFRLPLSLSMSRYANNVSASDHRTATQLCMHRRQSMVCVNGEWDTIMSKCNAQRMTVQSAYETHPIIDVDR